MEKAGNFEVPLGIAFADLLALVGGMRGGRKLKAVIPGGSSVPVVPGDGVLVVPGAGVLEALVAGVLEVPGAGVLDVPDPKAGG